jgi:hypothetical protein
MTTTKAPQAFAQVLMNHALLCSWHNRLCIEETLNSVIRAQLPRPLAERIRVAEFSDQTLTLAATAGAVAAIVRQRTPDILAALSRAGSDFTQIRVCVQVRPLPKVAEKSLLRQRDRCDTAPLKRLAATLAPGPLRDAVERLARRAG